MKKFQSFILAALLMLVGCTEINDRLDSLEQSVEEIKNTQITTIQQQIAAINASLPRLENTDAELKDYINALQQRVADLEEDLEATNNKITELQSSLQSEIDTEISQVILLLEAAKQDIASEISTINALIENLQTKSQELQKQIADLKEYVNQELSTTKDWVEATFATLNQYNELADIVAAIDIDAKTVNQLLDELEVRIDQKLAEAINNIDIDSALAETVTNITTEYKSAIASASDDITDAYNKAIKKAIEDLEPSIKSWVNTQLANYYTIAQMDAKLEVMQAALESKISDSENSIKSYIEKLEEEINKKVDENSKLITSLQNEIANLSAQAAQNASDIIQNVNDINANAEKIRQNAQAILDNNTNIEVNATLIAENKSLIATNNSLIMKNKEAISMLQNEVNANKQAIIDNATAIAQNAIEISANAVNIANNAAAISANASDIIELQEDLVATTKEITQAYKGAIENAITTLDGELRDHVASEVASINAQIDALDERVTALEKEVKNIKVAIYNIQGDVSALQEQVAAILARIQSISYVPKYADGNATMYYTNSNGTITAGNATLDFELQPAATASELVDVWESALSVRAVYTLTRAAGDFVNLSIDNVTANDGILTVVISGDALDEAFFRSEISANVRLQVSDGNNQRSSEYVNMVPWTTDNIYIPDANFKALLLDSYDTNSDGEISADEAASITSLDVSATIPQITSLEGIEYFINLATLDCSYNKITSLNLASNTKLTTLSAATNQLASVVLPSSITSLDLSGNKLTTVDVSKMKGLATLNVANNKLASLHVAQNKEITELLCLNNQLAALDVANLTLLATLNCSNNHIESLNLAKNTALTSLVVSKNNLTMLDVTKCNALQEFDCSNNRLTKLYMGNQPALSSLCCSGNALTALDLTGCGAINMLDCSDNDLIALNIVPVQKLQTLNCSTNALTMLDISNNAALKTLDCSANPSLAKLWVKNEEQLAGVTITKDNTTTTYYNNGGLYIPDVALKAYLVNNYDDDGDEEISIVEVDNITMVNCSGKGVADLTGLEACTNLVTLNCSNNSITTIKLPSLAKLRTLTCNGNPIKYINLDNCAALEYLNLQGVTTNAISGTSISIDAYTQATTFNISVKGTPFTKFVFTNDADISSLAFNGEFTDVNLSGNSVLEGIDVSTLTQLETLDVQKCNLQSLDVTKNLALTSLICNNNALTTLDVSNNVALVKLYCNDNKLPRINVTANTALQEFDIANNLLSVLNIRNNTALTYLCVSNNAEISMVDVQYNTALEILIASGLSITDIDLTANTRLKGAELCNTNLTALKKCSTTGLGIVYEIKTPYATGKMISIEKTSEDWNDAKTWCSNYGTDWYLPSIDELEDIYDKKSTIDSFLSAMGYTILGTSKYWSSTMYRNPSALEQGTHYYYLDFSNGSSGNYRVKDYTAVRAVLLFN